jgi:hypothetical protein
MEAIYSNTRLSPVCREALVGAGVARTPVKAPKARRETNAENRIEATEQDQMINDCDRCNQRSSERRSITTVTNDRLTAGDEISIQIDTQRYHPRAI